MDDQDLVLIQTGDGSDSLFSTRFQDSYHSRHGAVQESNHVFIQNGLHFCSQKIHSINLLELGFGTGLNLLLTRKFAQENPGLKIVYQTIEAFPISMETVKKLNYDRMFDAGWLHEIHQLPWDEDHVLNENLTLRKHLKSFEQISEVDSFDLIYFDAFAPQKQPALWEEDFLSTIARATKPGGILVTYCSQGAFRRALKKVGFLTEKLAGPPGKREMTRAIKL